MTRNPFHGVAAGVLVAAMTFSACGGDGDSAATSTTAVESSDSTATATGTATDDANTASVEEMTAAFEAAGVDNAPNDGPGRSRSTTPRTTGPSSVTSCRSTTSMTTPSSGSSRSSRHDSCPGSDPDCPVRRGLLILAASAAAGTALELAMLRHWNGVDQLVPWATLVIVAAGIAIVAFSGARAAVLMGRAIGRGSAVAGLFGLYEHIASNYEAGPLDFRYADRWATMSVPARLWAAASGTVGPSPALAPAIVALAGACLALATIGLPGAQVRVQETISGEQGAQEGTNRTSRRSQNATATAPSGRAATDGWN